MAGADNRLIGKITALQYRLMDKMRDRQAFVAAAQTPTGQDFVGFAQVRQCLLVTFKRSGEPVPSPLNHGVCGGKLYVRTEASSFKVKRLRHNPNVVVVPSGFRGTPTGPGVAATARILPDADIAHADAVIAANWSLGMKLVERTLDQASKRFDLPVVYIEFTPQAAATQSKTIT